MNYKYFTKEELSCKCGCGKADMDEKFMEGIEFIREEVGMPFIVTSAYRCPKQNAKVSNSSSDGAHTTGKAIDIKAGSRCKFEILNVVLNQTDINRIGIGKDFIHLDIDDTKDQRVIWTY